jgi:hypothetical protein
LNASPVRSLPGPGKAFLGRTDVLPLVIIDGWWLMGRLAASGNGAT